MKFNSGLKITPKTLLLFDIDGTATKLLHDPRMRLIDPHFMTGLRIIQHFFPEQAVGITGRDYNQVLQCMGGATPFFPVITSNGAALYTPDGNRYESPHISAEDSKFIDHMKTVMTDFSKRNPWLVVEIKEFSAGFHSSAYQGYGAGRYSQDELADMVTKSSQEVLDTLSSLHDESVELGLNFKLGGAEATNRELYHGAIDKAPSVGWFAPYLPTLPQNDNWTNVVFCGDSLIGHGNDREMAIKTNENGGVVCIVTNDSVTRMPHFGSPASPYFGAATPAELGYMLQYAAKGAVVQEYGMATLKKYLRDNREHCSIRGGFPTRSRAVAACAL